MIVIQPCKGNVSAHYALNTLRSAVTIKLLMFVAFSAPCSSAAMSVSHRQCWEEWQWRLCPAVTKHVDSAQYRRLVSKLCLYVRCLPFSTTEWEWFRPLAVTLPSFMAEGSPELLFAFCWRLFCAPPPTGPEDVRQDAVTVPNNVLHPYQSQNFIHF